MLAITHPELRRLAAELGGQGGKNPALSASALAFPAAPPIPDAAAIIIEISPAHSQR
jgi:hypothetical protein